MYQLQKRLVPFYTIAMCLFEEIASDGPHAVKGAAGTFRLSYSKSTPEIRHIFDVARLMAKIALYEVFGLDEYSVMNQALTGAAREAAKKSAGLDFPGPGKTIDFYERRNFTSVIAPQFSQRPFALLGQGESTEEVERRLIEEGYARLTDESNDPDFGLLLLVLAAVMALMAGRKDPAAAPYPERPVRVRPDEAFRDADGLKAEVYGMARAIVSRYYPGDGD